MNNPFETIDAKLSNIERLLLEIKRLPNEKVNEPQAEELLTVQGAAKFLSLSVPTIYGLIHKGEIPVMKRSKRCYFSKTELINYLKQGRKKTVLEIAIETDEFLAKNRKK